MEITEVRIKLTEDSDDRLQGFCSITFDDCFVVRDLKIIEGANGPFVAMPSRKLTFHCPRCDAKNHLRAAYCNHCGNRFRKGDDGPQDHSKLYADIAHPVNSECREMIQRRVIDAYNQEREQFAQPGYVSKYDDGYDDYDEVESKAVEDEQGQEAPAESKDETTPPESKSTSRQVHPGAAESLPRPPHGASKGSKEEEQEKASDKGGFGDGIFD